MPQAPTLAPAAAPVPARTAVRVVGAWLLAAVLHVLALVLAGAILPVSPALQPTGDDAATAGAMLPLVAALDAALLVAVVRRAEVGGWGLAGLLTLVWWGLATFMTQIETAWFLGAFPALGTRDLLLFFVRGLVFAVLWVPGAVAVAGGLRGGVAGRMEALEPGALATRGLPGKLAGLAALYAALYFVFGYHVAWRSPEVRAFYGGPAELHGLGAQLASVVATDPWLYPFQALRGLLWTAFAAPVLLLFPRRRADALWAVAALCALAPTTQLLYPNVLMPSPVRMAHLLEVATSTGLFGLAVAWVLGPRDPSTSPSRRA